MIYIVHELAEHRIVSVFDQFFERQLILRTECFPQRMRCGQCPLKVEVCQAAAVACDCKNDSNRFGAIKYHVVSQSPCLNIS